MEVKKPAIVDRHRHHLPDLVSTRSGTGRLAEGGQSLIHGRQPVRPAGRLTSAKFPLAKGFTFVEMLVSLGILGIVLIVAISTFMTVLTKSAKVKVAEAVENNGQYAMRAMEQMIRNAREVIPNISDQICEVNMSSLKVKNPSAEEIEFFCRADYISYNSGDWDYRLTSPEVKLVPGTCYFNCYPGGIEDPDRVEIIFTLGYSGTSTRAEEQFLTDFKTTVTLRNY